MMYAAFSLPKVPIIYSTSHMLVPKIMGVVIAALLALILITETAAKKRRGEKLKPERKKFFLPGYDKKKFWGVVVLSAVYVVLLKVIRFVPSSVICIFLYGVLFEGKREKISLAVSGISAVGFTVVVWFVFGYMFNITLP